MSSSAWNSPTFITPKTNGEVHKVSNFRKSNTNLVRKSYTMQELEGFKYAVASYLNMGYYIICLDPGSQALCIIITPCDKYKYLRLHMGIVCEPNICQEKIPL